MKGFSSRAIHGGAHKKDGHGALRFPIYDGAAFEFATSAAIEEAFAGRRPQHTYSRITNPTVEDFEQRMQLLSGGVGVIALSSGMAAIATTVLGLAEAGSNIIASHHIFGNTRSLFATTLKRWGLTVRFADLNDRQTVTSLIDEKTRLIFLESITNPQLEVVDVAELAAIAAERGVPVVLDGTLTTPYIFPSRLAGVAVEVISSTKYISGGATAVGGLIIDNGTFSWNQNPLLQSDVKRFGKAAFIARLRKEVYRNTGSCLAPHSAYLQTLGLETMALRVDRSCENALRIAEYLHLAPGVSAVAYPGLPDSPWYNTAKKQFSHCFGGIVTFSLASKEHCFAFMDRLQMIRRATNLNDNKTLVLHPASTIFAEFAPEERKGMGVTDELIRLSVGIEDYDDIVADVELGLRAS